jgi:hypothetical protein
MVLHADPHNLLSVSVANKGRYEEKTSRAAPAIDFAYTKFISYKDVSFV